MRRLHLVSVAIALAAGVPGVAQESVVYVWDSGSEGFVASQGTWANQVGYWGGSLESINHSARMIQTTTQTEQAFIEDFIACFASQSDPSTVTVALDAFKDSVAGWKAPTGNPMPPDTSVFDNSWANLIMIMIAVDGTQYLYGSELNAQNGWEAGVSLDYLGEREYTPIFGDLEIWYQTYQLAQHVDYWYGVDNLNFGFVESCPRIFGDGFESGDTTAWAAP